MIFHCPHCGIKVTPEDRNCPTCRKRMVRACPACAEEIAVGAPLCKYCGETVSDLRPPLRKAAAPATPDIEFIEEPAKSCVWEDTKRGLVRRWWGTFIHSTFRPGHFFRTMPATGGHRWPVGYAYGLVPQLLFLAALAITGLFGLDAAQGRPISEREVWTWTGMLTTVIPATFVVTVLALHLVSLLWHLPLKVLGARGGYEATLRTIGYSSGAYLWATVPAILLAAGLIPETWAMAGLGLAFLHHLRLHYHGFRNLHGMGWFGAALGALLPYLVLFGLAAAWFGTGCCGLPAPDGAINHGTAF